MHSDSFESRPGLRHVPDPFGRLLPAPEPEPEIENLRDPLHILDSVGMEGANARRDVAKVETLLGRTGDLDLAETDGVTGFMGLRLDEAVRRFQKRHGLKVDGHIGPGGETLATLGAELAAGDGDKASEKEDSEQTKPESGPVPLDSKERPGSGSTAPSPGEKIFGPASGWLGDVRKPNPFPITGPGVGGTRW